MKLRPCSRGTITIASSLGIGHVRVPLIAPFNLGVNGNAITVTGYLDTPLISLPAWVGDRYDVLLKSVRPTEIITAIKRVLQS